MFLSVGQLSFYNEINLEERKEDDEYVDVMFFCILLHNLFIFLCLVAINYQNTQTF